MGTRWVIHDDDLSDGVDASGLLRQLAGDGARDASVGVVKRTGRTSQNIEVTEVTDTRAVVTASPKNPNSNPGHQEYAAHLERGTSDTDAQPFMRPALYRYRSP